MFRKLRTWLKKPEETEQVDLQQLREQIAPLLRDDPDDELSAVVDFIHSADIANLLDELQYDEVNALFARLPTRVAAEVLVLTSTRVRTQLVDQVEDARLAEMLDLVPVDDAVEFVSDLPEPTAERLIGLMHPEEAREVRHLLAYKGETAGRLMTTDVAALRSDWTVSDTLDYLRSLGDATETLHYLYVVDSQRTLVGVVPLRTLLLAKAAALIETIMIRDVVTVPVNADQEELAEMIARYDLFAMPVVDAQNRLLGVVTVDDVLDVVEAEATEDIQRLGGSEPLSHPYFAVSPFQVAGKRIVWLLPLFCASVMTDLIIHRFDGLLAHVVTLTVFIPMVIGTAGNAGSQTVATIIRAIATGEIRLADVGRALLREASVAVILGLVLGAAAYVRSMTLGAEPMVGIVLAVTLPLVILVANSLATVVPLVAERLGIDPTVISAPMITTLLDATGLFIYLVIAAHLLL